MFVPGPSPGSPLSPTEGARVILLIPAGILFLFLGISVFLYWKPFIHLLTKPDLPLPPKRGGRESSPSLVVLVPCFNEELHLKGLAETFSHQDYPRDRYRLVIVADHCTDQTAEVGRSLGMTVIERKDGPRSWRGAAVNDVLSTHLKKEEWQGLVLLDVDAKLEPDFLSRVGLYLSAGVPALQCATRTKNPTESPLAQVGDLIQVLIRNHQHGRSVSGYSPFIIGSHGVVVSRKSVECLHWRTNTDQLADDVELGLRCFLNGILFRYAADIVVYNDVVSDAKTLRRQRRRWSQSSLTLIGRYTVPLLLRALSGQFRAWDMLFGVLLMPAFSTLLFLSVGASVVFGGMGFWHREFFVLAGGTLLLTFAHVGYLLSSLAKGGKPVRGRDLGSLFGYCWERFISLVQAPFSVKPIQFRPASHVEKKN